MDVRKVMLGVFPTWTMMCVTVKPRMGVTEDGSATRRNTTRCPVELLGFLASIFLSARQTVHVSDAAP